MASTDQQRRGRQQIQDRIRQQRDELAAVHSQQHKLEMATDKLRHERQTLVERMQDDYGINLSEAAGELASVDGDTSSFPLPAPCSLLLPEIQSSAKSPSSATKSTTSVPSISKRSTSSTQLEARFGGLSQQYRDLVEAKASLERIIQRINVDSRQLFLATLETIRGHFQELFRRLFGGGEADIVVDEAEDVLECGIEIVARPPGKEACSISLLSGGEKTLTCVALLLAVFRSKPSPFCILDEVDAALDEANIGRFVGVLREFLSFTQFIVDHAFEKDDVRRGHALRRHDGRIRRLEARLGAVRRCQRRWPHPPQRPPQSIADCIAAANDDDNRRAA